MMKKLLPFGIIFVGFALVIGGMFYNLQRIDIVQPQEPEYGTMAVRAGVAAIVLVPIVMRKALYSVLTIAAALAFLVI